MSKDVFRLAVSAMVLAAPMAARAEKAAGGHAGAEFQMMDKNGDGKISEAEHAAGARRMFEMMDANKDGKVNALEMETAHARVTGHKVDKKNAATMSAAQKIKVVDTDGDGVLTTEEHAAGSKLMFEKMDTDQDGALTRSELEAGHAKLMSGSASKSERNATGH
ncbi:MAG: hypothetical protein ABUL67_03960 [Haliangium ochraceum]